MNPIPYPFNRLLLGLNSRTGKIEACRLLVMRMVKAMGASMAVLSLPDKPAMPIRLQVENTSRCNLRCVMCGRRYRNRSNDHMSVELHCRLLEEIRPVYLTLNGDGEPLLDPGLVEKIRAAKRMGCVVTMPSNMTLMRGEAAKQIAESGLDLLTASIDGATKISYEAIRIGANFEDVVANVGAFQDMLARQTAPAPPELRVLCVLQARNLFEFGAVRALEKKLRIRIQLVPVKYMDHEEVSRDCEVSADALARLEREIREVCEKESDPDVREFHTRWLRVAQKVGRPEGPGRICLKPWTTAYIDSSGDVYPCCLAVDDAGSLKMGSVRDRSFRDIWHGKAYAAYREQMIIDRRNVAVCSICPSEDAGLVSRARRYCGWLPVRLRRVWRAGGV